MILLVVLPIMKIEDQARLSAAWPERIVNVVVGEYYGKGEGKWMNSLVEVARRVVLGPLQSVVGLKLRQVMRSGRMTDV